MLLEDWRVRPPATSRSADLAQEATTLQAALTSLNRARLTPSLGDGDWEDALASELGWRRLEEKFLREERAAVAQEAAAAPTEARAFVAWFEQLREDGPGQHDVLFEWLASAASLEQMRWFLKQEVAGEAGFDDLVALTQVRLPTRAKLELARNYWDEMGQGQPGGMHGPMLEVLARALEVERVPGEIVWEAQALGNLLVGLAMNRRHAYHSIGALGVIELTAPDRAERVNDGLRRLGVGGAERRYFALHATLDRRHSAAWNQEVLAPLVAADPRLAPAIAEGALMRLRAGARCFARYRSELGLGSLSLARA